MKLEQARLKEILHYYQPINNHAINAVAQITEVIEFEKSSLFIKKNSIDSFEYFVMHGVCRSYIFNTEGKDVTIGFYDEGRVLAPNITRTQNNHSTMNFECLTDCVLGRFLANEFQNLMNQSTAVRAFGHNVLQSELSHKINKEIYNASLPAKERLLKFREKYKMLENRVYHPHIASYLGITNISLSRIRKELATK